MIYFLALLPATALVIGGYFVMCRSDPAIAGETLGPGLRRQILRDSDMEPDDFSRCL